MNDVMNDVMDDVMDDVMPRVLFAVVYCVIFLLGVAGNSLVVYVVVRSRAMRTVTNVFIANLAVADIMMCLLAVPFTPLSGLLRSDLMLSTIIISVSANDL